jgi:hypothetical protein
MGIGVVSAPFQQLPPWQSGREIVQPSDNMPPISDDVPFDPQTNNFTKPRPSPLKPSPISYVHESFIGEGPNEGSGEGTNEQSRQVVKKPTICADFDTGEAVQCTVDNMGRTLVSYATATAAANAVDNTSEYDMRRAALKAGIDYDTGLPIKKSKQDITTIVLFAVAGFAIFKLMRG